MEKLKNIEAEKSVIGELIRGGKDSQYILTTLKPEFFYETKHGIIFRSISKINEKKEKADLVFISAELENLNQLEKIGGYSYLVSAVNSNMETFNAKFHADMVRELFIARKSWEILADNAQKIKEKKYEKIEEVIGKTFSDIVETTSSNVEERKSMHNIIDDFMMVQDEYAKKKQSGQDLIGIPTGYKAINNAIEGYRPEHLWTIAALTSVGKSSLMMNLIKSLLIAQNRRVVVFSLEMSKTDLLAKLVALQAQISPLATIKNTADEEISEKSVQALGELHSRDLTIYSEVSDIDEIILRMQFEMLQKPVDVFFIDYLQNISSAKSKDEYHLLTEAVKKIQITTRRLGTTTVLLSQVSNETKKNSNLDVDGKGSGAIKAASNFFMYLKREGLEDELAKCFESGADIPLKCIINKNRHGRIGSFNLALKQITGEIVEI